MRERSVAQLAIRRSLMRMNMVDAGIMRKAGADALGHLHAPSGTSIGGQFISGGRSGKATNDTDQAYESAMADVTALDTTLRRIRKSGQDRSMLDPAVRQRRQNRMRQVEEDLAAAHRRLGKIEREREAMDAAAKEPTAPAKTATKARHAVAPEGSALSADPDVKESRDRAILGDKEYEQRQAAKKPAAKKAAKKAAPDHQAIAARIQAAETADEVQKLLASEKLTIADLKKIATELGGPSANPRGTRQQIIDKIAAGTAGLKNRPASAFAGTWADGIDKTQSAPPPKTPRYKKVDGRPDGMKASHGAGIFAGTEEGQQMRDAIGTSFRDEAKPRKKAKRSEDADSEADVWRAAGHDTTPGHDELHHYWVAGPGLARWAESPKPWTTLLANLVEEVKDKPLEVLKKWASAWFLEHFHYAAGSDKNRVAHGHPPRGSRIGPG
jgi:hypothetical protein